MQIFRRRGYACLDTFVKGKESSGAIYGSNPFHSFIEFIVILPFLREAAFKSMPMRFFYSNQTNLASFLLTRFGDKC